MPDMIYCLLPVGRGPKIATFFFAFLAFWWFAAALENYQAIHHHPTDPEFQNHLELFHKIISSNHERHFPLHGSDNKNIQNKIIIYKLSKEKSMYQDLTIALIFVILSLGMYTLKLSERGKKNMRIIMLWPINYLLTNVMLPFNYPGPKHFANENAPIAISSSIVWSHRCLPTLQKGGVGGWPHLIRKIKDLLTLVNKGLMRFVQLITNLTFPYIIGKPHA